MNNTTAIQLFIVLLFIVAIASAIPFIVIIDALFVVWMDYKKKKKRVFERDVKRALIVTVYWSES